MADAARTLSSESAGLQLRYLQTLAEIAGGGKSSTTVFPIPIDLIGPFYDQLREAGGTPPPPPTPIRGGDS